MKLNKKVLMIAVCIGLIAVMLLYNYINGLKVETIAPADLTKVVTVINTIPANIKITADMLSTISIPTDMVHPDAVLDKSKVIGKMTKSEIIKGEQLLFSRVVTDVNDGSYSYRIPDNMRAITIANDEVSGVGGYIIPGDKVDVIVCYTIESGDVQESKVYTQLKNIEVFEVGPNVKTTEKEEDKEVATSLTLLVTPEQAEKIVYASENGKIHISLRNPMDQDQDVKTKGL